MELSDIKERLNNLDSAKLIDVVKNYRQYGYNDDIRTYALTILAGKGISMEDLRLTGNFENTTYSFANNLYQNYRQNSKIAFIAYCIALLLEAISIFQHISSALANIVLMTGLILSTLIFIIFLIKTFFTHQEFDRLTGSELSSEGVWLYLVLGMPFYFIMYFFLRKQMKERMTMIR